MRCVFRPGLAAVLLSLAAPVQAQGHFPPDSLANLRFFPANTPVRELVGQMRFFTSALGVRCQYCHIGQEGQPLDSFNFRSDDKRTKLTARVMLEMVKQINAQHLSLIPERPTPGVEVTCMTCHRGVARPADLAALVLDAVTQSSADSAVRLYRGLRERFYGRAAYDFGEVSLNSASEGLAAQRRFDDALRLLQLNAEFFPASAQIYARMGEAQLMKGDTAGAIASYRQTLLRDPTAAFARRRLRELGQTPN
jgi:tetratricopeptide (TPR) repeat protein